MILKDTKLNESNKDSEDNESMIYLLFIDGKVAVLAKQKNPDRIDPCPTFPETPPHRVNYKQTV